MDITDGLVKVKDGSGLTRVFLSADKSNVKLYNEEGQLVVTVGSTASLVLGGGGAHGDILMVNSAGNQTMHISGEGGDVILKNADAAEDFDVVNAPFVEAGSVLVIDDEYQLKLSSEPYDRRVAGVVSGAGHFQPGLILDRQGDSPDRLPVALAGKVMVRADASESPIKVGDLLTSSAVQGVAMCATDPQRAFGAVIGKALTPLSEGTGHVAILVSLQ